MMRLSQRICLAAKSSARASGHPGPLDPKTGTILFSANMNVRDFPLGAELSAALGRPVLVRNDVRVAGVGEFRLGIGRGYRDVIAAFVGTGIGGCIIRSGQIIEGLTGNAGEIGHMIVKAGGPRCGCGARGCMEALASKTAIARRVEKAIRKGLPTVLADKMARKGGRLKSGDLVRGGCRQGPGGTEGGAAGRSFPGSRAGKPDQRLGARNRHHRRRGGRGAR